MTQALIENVHTKCEGTFRGYVSNVAERREKNFALNIVLRSRFRMSLDLSRTLSSFNSDSACFEKMRQSFLPVR